MIKFLQPATCRDIAILSVFAVLITFHPFYLHGELNFFELGIYLPGINALLDGAVPYRDFFHLRGPLELHVPAFFMSLFGENVVILSTYFYVGSVITLLIGIGIAQSVYRTRFILYLMVPVFIGRTFPRVTFTYWGGMRYALGLLAIFFAVYFFQRRKYRWIVYSGVATALAGLTSIEVGVCALAAVGIACSVGWLAKVYGRDFIAKAIGRYALGIMAVVVPYFVYLAGTHALGAYFESTWAVATKMTQVFPDRLLEPYPGSPAEILSAMLPWGDYFKLLTPAYCFLFFAIYTAVRIKRGAMEPRVLAVVCVAAYGLVMYLTAFRKLPASQFEMALQPEKIILFFMLEEAFLFLWDQKQKIRLSLAKRPNRSDQWKLAGIYFLALGLIMSSSNYALMRYDRRFFAFQYVKSILLGKDTRWLRPLAGEQSERMRLSRLKGMVVPSWQAEDFKQLTDFFQRNTTLGETVLMYPELGMYSFIIDRPFVGRFPMATFSWIGEWHQEFMEDLKAVGPRFAVLPKDPGPTFAKAHFKIPSNKHHYDDVMRYIAEHYGLVDSTPSLLIYARKRQD